jgi:hypothetical protein
MDRETTIPVKMPDDVEYWYCVVVAVVAVVAADV